MYTYSGNIYIARIQLMPLFGRLEVIHFEKWQNANVAKFQNMPSCHVPRNVN